MNAIKVESPCSESWDEMSGNDQVRFCSHCSFDVNNLSSMRQRDAMRLVRRSKGRICVRYAMHPATGEPLYREQLHQINRRAPAIAAGVVGATLSLASLAFAQGGPLPLRSRSETASPATRPDTAKDAETETKGALAGTILDQNGAAVPGRMVVVRSSEGGISRRVTSDDDGKYEIANLPDGMYRLTVESGDGYGEVTLDDLSVAAGNVHQQIIPLPVAQQIFFTSGVMVSSGRTEFRNPLTKAVYAEDLDKVNDQLGRGADPNAPEEDGSTAIFVAVADGETEIVRALLLFGADINARDNDGETPLMQLDDDATVELVELLINSGAKVNRTAKDGTTALMRAAADSPADVLKALVDAEAEINAADAKGWTALMRAAYDDDIDKVRMLIFAGAEVNAKNNEGETAWDQTTNSDVEDLLVTHGAIVEDEQEQEEYEEEPAEN